MKITGELKDKMIAFLADPESRKIVASVLKEPKTATGIMTELDMPSSSAYRRISDLKECGLLMVDSFLIRPDGKREALYLSSFSEISFKDEAGALVLDVTPSKKSLERRWFDLFFSRTSLPDDRDSAASGRT